MDDPNETTSVVKDPQPQVTPTITELVPGAEKVGDKGAADKGSQEPPQTRTYSEDEWNKRQSAIDKRIADLQKASDDAVQKSADARLEAERKAEEIELNTFLRSIEDQGGDSEAAKLIVDAKKQMAEERRTWDKTKRQLETERNTLREAGKAKKAIDLIKEFSLPEGSEDKLMTAEDGTQMENTAMRLHLENIKSLQVPSTTVDAGQQQKPAGDLDKLSASEKLGKLMEEALNK